MCPSAPRVCSEPGGQKPVLSLSLDLEKYTVPPPPLFFLFVIFFVVIINHYCCHYSGAVNCKNRSNYDTSNRFGTNTLWGSLFTKKTRATQNFNMAAIFQDGRHGVSLNGIFALKMAINGQKRLLWQQSVCFEHAKCAVDVIDAIKMFILFQYGHQFPRWPPSAIA